MSSNVYEDPNVTLNVRYSKGVKEDRGVRVERRVDIYESADGFTDRCVDLLTEDRGTHSHKPHPAVKRNPFKAAALVLGLLCLLLVAAVTVLSKLYISIVVEKQQLNTSLVQLQNSFRGLNNKLEELQTSNQELQTSRDKTDCQFQGEESWKRFGCSCYYKSAEKKNWTESRRDCQNRGADLVIINNKGEDDFVGELGKQGSSWIGLSVKTRKDWELKSEWKWVDGSAPGYMGWATGVTTMPEDGSLAYIDQQGTWDHTKEGLKHWICERTMN